MVVLKHILLATLATLAVATPAAQWGNQDHSAAAVAPQSRPSGNASGHGGGGGSGEHGGRSKEGNYPSSESGSPDSGGKHDHKQRRSWSNGSPDGSPAGGGHSGMSGGDGSGSQEHGHWPPSSNGKSGQGHFGAGQSGGGQPGHEEPDAGQSGNPPPGNGQSGHGQSGTGQSGDAQPGNGQSGHKDSGSENSGNAQSGNGHSSSGQSPGTGADGSSNTHNQPQARDEPKHRGFGSGKSDGPRKERTPDTSGDHEHHRREAFEARDASPGVTLPGDDPRLIELRKGYFGGSDNDDDLDGAAGNATEHDGDGNDVSRRGAKVYGIYECMNHDFVAPCVWTQLADGQCYNALYGQTGSMGPDKGLCCTVYQLRSCNDDGFQKVVGFVWPGIGNYGHSQFLVNEGLADEGIPSVMCKVASTCPKPKSSHGGF